MKNVIGIDPGASGGIAICINGDSNAYPMPETRGELIRLFKSIIAIAGGPYNVIAYLESPNNYIPDASISSMAEYGRKLERPVCILETLNVRTVEISPRKWQKMFEMGTSERIVIRKDFTPEEKAVAKKFNSKAKKEWKYGLCLKAKQIFPHLKVNLKNCDALLILSYGVQNELDRLL
jgi:hypothetical protein